MINGNNFDVNKAGFTVNVDIDEVKNQGKREEKFSRKKEIFEWLDVVSAALIVVVLIFGFVFRVATISGDSMLNTLHNGEMVIIRNIFYKAEAGDIVVISRNVENTAETDVVGQGPIIKRIIATENQVVDIDFEKNVVYVDGVALKEDYVSTPINKRDVDFPVQVPEGHVFVLGDNRSISLDSRSSSIGNNGMVDERYILGQAIFRVFPFTNIGRLDNK
jgi:signal peptidase I